MFDFFVAEHTVYSGVIMKYYGIEYSNGNSYHLDKYSIFKHPCMYARRKSSRDS